MGSNPNKQYEFDIAKNRLQTLGALVSERTAAYYRFRKDRDSESAEHMLNILASLLLELEQDGEDIEDVDVEEMWSKVNSMDQRLQQGQFQYKSYRKKIEDVNRDLEKIRKKSGLDIPSRALKEEGQEMLS